MAPARSTLLKSIAGSDALSRRDAIVLRRRADRRPAGPRRGRARHRAGAGRTAAVSLAHRRGEPADRRAARPAGPVESRARLRAVSGARPSGDSAEHVALRRPAADGGDRPRADVQSAAAAVRRDQPRPCADRRARHLCRAAGHRARRNRRSSSSSRTSCRRSPPRPASTACRKAALSLAGAPAH